MFTTSHRFAEGIRALTSTLTMSAGAPAPNRNTSVNVVDADTYDLDDVLTRPGTGSATILVLSPHGCLDPLRRHLGTAVGAALAPSFATKEFLAALDAVVTGGLYLHAAFVPGVRFAPPAAAAGRGALLTSREREVHAALCRAQSNQQIADALDVSPRTIRFHVSNILKKLDLQTRSHIIAAHATAGGVG